MIRAARPQIGHRVRVRGIVCGVVSLLAAACTSGGSGGRSGAGSATAPAASSASQAGTSIASTASGKPTPKRPQGEFTIAFAGDVHFSGLVAQRLREDPGTVFAQATSALKASDLTMDNHGADYGSSGLSDTLAAISKTRFLVVGIGRNAADAYSSMLIPR